LGEEAEAVGTTQVDVDRTVWTAVDRAVVVKSVSTIEIRKADARDTVGRIFWAMHRDLTQSWHPLRREAHRSDSPSVREATEVDVFALDQRPETHSTDVVVGAELWIVRLPDDRDDRRRDRHILSVLFVERWRVPRG